MRPHARPAWHVPTLARVVLVSLSLGAGAAGARAAGAAEAAAAPSRAAAASGYSAPRLYNEGNAYARSGQFALAVLAYERARLIDPTDADLEANLSRARAAAGLPVRRGSWLDACRGLGDPNALYWIGLSGLLLGGGSLLALLRRPPYRGAIVAFALLGAGMTVAGLLDAAAVAPVLSESVVLRPAAASVSPVTGADELFTVPAADTVRVLDEHGGFALIRDSAGREGWVADADLAHVIPARQEATR